MTLVPILGSASSIVIICIGLYWSTCGHVMVRKTKKRPAISSDPFLACMVGSGNETVFCILKLYQVDLQPII